METIWHAVGVSPDPHDQQFVTLIGVSPLDSGQLLLDTVHDDPL